MATPAEIEGKTLEELRTMRTLMNGARWLLELEDEDEETRTQAALHQLRVQHAIMELENARLLDIRDKLIDNETALEEGRQRLVSARQNFEDATVVIEALGGFLQVVGHIAALII